MRILRIADVPDNRTSGVTRFMRFVGDELIHDGHEVEYLFQDGIGLQRVDYRARRFLVPWRIARLIRSRVAQGRRPDVVEIHEPSAAAYSFARRFDPGLPPLLVMSHGVESRCHRVMLDYLIQKKGRVSWKERHAYRITSLWQSDHSLKHADQVALSTTEDQAYLFSDLAVAPDRVTIVNGGITSTFLNCPTGPSPGQGVVFLASWVVRKGILDLVPALTRLVRERPGCPVTIAGTGRTADQVLADFPEDCRSKLRVIPHVPGDLALLEEYRRHSVYLAPSVFEGQLLTMLEAAAAGLAVIATATCGMKDFVSEGVNGLLIPLGDPDALFAATVSLIDDPGLARRLGAQAQSQARQYTWRRAADQFSLAIAKALAHCNRQ